mmetsp:Transcript_8115/g.22641  ORF Transcript_8115/g.22641 Transcript_8115/m.22641 type:complete len:84 (+) Transcript_8115:419-670(+)
MLIIGSEVQKSDCKSFLAHFDLLFCRSIGIKLIVKHFREYGLTVHTGTKDTDGKVLKKSKTEFIYIPFAPRRERRHTKGSGMC